MEGLEIKNLVLARNGRAGNISFDEKIEGILTKRTIDYTRTPFKAGCDATKV
jgi:hypothetical protein